MTAPSGEGFFGPDSVSWRIHQDAAAIPGAGRALLLQALNPYVMDVFMANSDYKDDPWGRLRRTGDYFRDVVFGDRTVAERAGRGVRKLHARLIGVPDPETDRVYRADDPDLLLWVHATAVDSFLASFRRYGGWVSRRDADRYVAEQVKAAELVGIQAEAAPSSFGELQEYIAGVTGLRLTASSEAGMEMILFDPPISDWLRPAWLGIAAAIVSILPPYARELYRLPWFPPLDPPVRLVAFGAGRAFNAYHRVRRLLEATA